MYGIVVLAAFLASATAQVLVPGVCNVSPTGMNAVRIVNEELLAGTWYQIARINNNYETGDCVTTTNSIVLTNNVFARGVAASRQVFNQTATWRNATFTSLSNGVYSYQYPDILLSTVFVATDYTGFALLYSCLQANTTHKQVYAWQLARSNLLTLTQSRLISAAISSTPDLTSVSWRPVGHLTENCRVSGASTVLMSPVILAILSLITFVKIF